MQPLSRGRDAAPARTWTWLLAGTSAAALVAAGAFRAAAIGERDDGHASAADHWTVASDVALAGAFTCALSAALLYMVESREAPARTQDRR
jgi:hypothetical protein